MRTIRSRALGLAPIALLALVAAACGGGTPAATPTPAPTVAPVASQPPAPAASMGVTLDGATVTVVGTGRSTSDAFPLPAGNATMRITACQSNGVMPFITLLDPTGTSAGLIVDPEKLLKNLAGGDYRVAAQANPDCVWQVVITPEAGGAPAATSPATGASPAAS